MPIERTVTYITLEFLDRYFLVHRLADYSSGLSIVLNRLEDRSSDLSITFHRRSDVRSHMSIVGCANLFIVIHTKMFSLHMLPELVHAKKSTSTQRALEFLPICSSMQLIMLLEKRLSWKYLSACAAFLHLTTFHN